MECLLAPESSPLAPDFFAETETETLCPGGVPSRTIVRVPNENLTDEVFRQHWARGYPIVVANASNEFQLPWSPQYFKDNHGLEPCTLDNYPMTDVKATTVAEFFSDFGEVKPPHSRWKLKVSLALLS